MSETEIGVILVTVGEPAEELASSVKKLSGYSQVEVAHLERGMSSPSLHETIELLVSSGVERILVIPTLRAYGNERLQTQLGELLSAAQAAHPTVEFTAVLSLVDAAQQAQLLVQALARYEDGVPDADAIPLSVLSTRESGTVERLEGGHEFVSRLATLGFIPGSPIEVIQNFGVGPLIVAIRDSRIALGRREARKVRVRRCFEKECGKGHHSRPRGWRRRRFG